MAVTATILVDFTRGSEVDSAGHLSAEIDDRPTGLNGGLTTFQPGDTAFFFVHTSSNVIHSEPVPSAGSIVSATSGPVTREEQVIFPNTSTATLPVPAIEITAYEWMGNSLGVVTLIDEMTVVAAGIGVGVCKITYITQPTAYGIQSPASINGETEFDILVYVRGEVVA